jgi:hypothetical protein
LFQQFDGFADNDGGDTNSASQPAASEEASAGERWMASFGRNKGAKLSASLEHTLSNNYQITADFFGFMD